MLFPQNQQRILLCHLLKSARFSYTWPSDLGKLINVCSFVSSHSHGNIYVETPLRENRFTLDGSRFKTVRVFHVRKDSWKLANPSSLISSGVLVTLSFHRPSRRALGGHQRNYKHGTSNTKHETIIAWNWPYIFI